MKISIFLSGFVVMCLSLYGVLFLAVTGYFKKIGLTDADVISLMMFGISFGIYLFCLSDFGLKKYKKLLGYTTAIMFVVSAIVIVT